MQSASVIRSLKYFFIFSVDAALVTVVRRLLDFVNMNLVEPVVEKRQKRIFGRVIVAVKKSSVLVFKLDLGIALCLVDHRFW